ncbi:hypothetical protein NC651_028137 [Populus alba x Populus x berolinensis]|nr:hypothetical protein NC651_028137 [Populus alba x Populus x berolinensis]
MVMLSIFKQYIFDDKGHVWTFKCSVRKKGQYPKPVLAKGWLPFVASQKKKKKKPLNLATRSSFTR